MLTNLLLLIWEPSGPAPAPSPSPSPLLGSFLISSPFISPNNLSSEGISTSPPKFLFSSLTLLFSIDSPLKSSLLIGISFPNSPSIFSPLKKFFSVINFCLLYKSNIFEQYIKIKDNISQLNEFLCLKIS